MKGPQRLQQQPLLHLPCKSFRLLLLLLQLLVPSPRAAKAALRGGSCIMWDSRRTTLVPAFIRPMGMGSSNGSSSRLFSRGRFMLHPRLRVRRLSRGSGGSHVLELARQRLLLQLEGDLEKYMMTPLLPFPAEGEVHSQRKRSKAPPPGPPLPALLMLQRQVKLLLRRHRGTKNSRRVLQMRERLLLLQQQQPSPDSPEPDPGLLRKLWGIDAEEKQQRQQQEHFQQHQLEHERQNAWLEKRLTRPVGSRFLFICGIDLKVAGTDLENLFQTLTQYPVSARLKRSKEGRHLGFGLMEFGSTLDATRCLLQLNGIKVGSSNIRLGEALLPRKVVEPQQRQEQQTPEPQGQRRRQGRYIHPYPLPCE